MRLFLTILCFQSLQLWAIDSTFLKKLDLSLYNEIYYSQNLNDLNQTNKPNFLYNHKQENTLGINTLIGKISIKDSMIRGTFGMIFGAFAANNMSEEPSWARNLYEANFGFKIMKKHNVWFDLGLMNSHIGFESAVGADCWTLTRSILAENSPYYETGAKLSYTSNDEKIYIAALYLNGWQNIAKISAQSNHSLGAQFIWKPNDKFTFNYSNFFGNAQPDSNRNMRFYNNFYAIYEKSKWGFILGFDLGMDKNIMGENGIWYSPLAIVKYKFNDNNTLAIRGEYFNDPKNIIIESGRILPIQLGSFSSNYDFRFLKRFLWRNEVKYFLGNQNLFNNNKNNFSITSSISVMFK